MPALTKYIYAASTRSGEVVWIGATLNPRARRDELRKRWLLDLFALTILEVCDERNWRKAERKWIRIMRERGEPLRNRSKGGESGPELRRLMGLPAANPKHVTGDVMCGRTMFAHCMCACCNYEWDAYVDNPKKCPRCSSRKWQEPKHQLTLGKAVDK